MNKILSIIIPYYNAKEYTDELLSLLDKQIDTEEIEVLLIDDGSKEEYTANYNWLKIIRQDNGGASAARNTGLDNAIGEYISFIDSDDLISDNYIETILNKIKEEHFDYMFLSWDSFGGWNTTTVLKSVNDEFPDWNLCVWNRVYKRELIGNIRFNIKKLIAEDAQFIRAVQTNCKKKSFTDKILYHYRSNTPNSLTKRFANGDLSTERIVYYYNKITKDMQYLIDDVKLLDKYAEVIIMTNDNQLPELKNYAMVMKPTVIKGTELRGEDTSLFTKVDIPIKTQLVIWTDKTFAIGGIETFIYSFCLNMKKYYDIIVLYNEMDIEQIRRLQPHVKILKNNLKTKIICDNLLVNRITDSVPNNIIYNKKIQMIHCCKLVDNWKVNQNNDVIIPVSSTVKESFKEDIGEHKNEVINNLMYPIEKKRVLRLITGTRLTFEKGKNRIITLAKELNKKQIPFIWTIFTDTPLKEKIDGVVCMPPTLDLTSWIAASDYLIQLSDSEAFCYSLVEALSLGVPVITTPLPILDDIGFEEGINGWTVPFDMNNIDNIIDNIYNIKLNFNYKYDNTPIIEKWRHVLGNTQPLNTYKYTPEKIVKIRIIKTYYDTELKRNVKPQEIIETKSLRADLIVSMGYARYI